MDRDKKKHQKQKKRDQKKSEQKRHAEKVQAAERIRQRRDQYPEISFDETEGTPEFVELVRCAAGEVDLADPKLFPS